jgi:hypothetical protein
MLALSEQQRVEHSEQQLNITAQYCYPALAIFFANCGIALAEPISSSKELTKC